MSTGVNIPTNSSEPIENQVIVICGPTSVGKSAVASRLCATLPSEMLLADAVQVYRHLDIGSNKPRPEEMVSVPHHLVDICEPPFENFTAGEFVRTAVPIVDDIIGRGRLPVFVGGNTMWVQWLMQGTPDAPKGSDDLRKQVAQQLRELERAGDWEAGLLLLQKLDSSRAEKLFRNDWYRLSRYLEIAYSLRADDEGRVSKMEDGSSSSSSTATLQNTRQTHLSAYDVRGFFVTEDREQLYHTIDERCVDMLTNGLFEEVTSLLQRGLLPPDFIGTKSIGYRQTIRYLVKQPRTLGDMEALEDYIKLVHLSAFSVLI